MNRYAFDIVEANHKQALGKCRHLLKEGKLEQCQQLLNMIENNLNDLEKMM
jgi:outer membrane PBP1 activator LpoA protein